MKRCLVCKKYDIFSCKEKTYIIEELKKLPLVEGNGLSEEDLKIIDDDNYLDNLCLGCLRELYFRLTYVLRYKQALKEIVNE